MITSKRLNIRYFAKEDFHDTYAIYKDPATVRYLLHEVWRDGDAQSLFDEKLTQRDPMKELHLAVVFEERVIGDLVVRHEGMKDSFEIGYCFNADVKGQGFALEACRALITWLFETQSAHRLIAYLDARNLASARLCERLGMRREAHFIQDYWNKGEWTDSFVYALLADDFKTCD